jgi:hypothetical protein
MDVDSEVDEILEKFKIQDLKSDGTLKFPELKLVLYDDKKKIEQVTNQFVFEKPIGNVHPFFMANVKLNFDNGNINEYLVQVDDTILLENIVLLNSLWTEPNPLTELSDIPQFKVYISSMFRVKSNLYSFYEENLKKLVFFSLSLFKSVMKLVIKGVLKKKETINTGETNDELLAINEIVQHNIEIISKIVLNKLKKYKINVLKYLNNNIYQIPDGIIFSTSREITKKYKMDYESDFKSFGQFLKKNVSTDHGNFYIVVKQRGQSNEAEVILGDFNSYLRCTFDYKIKKNKIDCITRKKKIQDFFNGLFVKVSRGGSKRRYKKRRTKRRNKKTKSRFKSN